MWSVREGLEHFIQSLELTDGQQQEVVRQQTLVRECLIHRLKPMTTFLSGSYSRSTAIRPLHDIDLFVVLGETAPPGGYSASSGSITADSVLKQVRQALKEQWPNKQLPILQQHSVHIGFENSGIEFDVVPAYRVPTPGQEVYRIPERKTGNWVRTNPNIHKERSTEANERAGKKLKPLLKAVKHWNRGQDSSPLGSFHLEVMSYSAFPTPPRNYIEGLELLFSHLSQKVLVSCPEPARMGPDVDHLMTSNQRQAAQQLLASAARQMQLVGAECDDRPESAHARLVQLFGQFYRKG